MFKRIFIANRGEIAVRIVKACRELGVTSIVAYSDADRNSLHVRVSDEAYYIGPSPTADSYLNSKKILSLAKKVNADAIHPGYGFFSENADFIKLVEESGIKFIGPSFESVSLMGNKTSARKIMKNNGVPIVPGTTSPISSYDDAVKICNQIGFPIMLKASAGGGGKGMRRIDKLDDLKSGIERARNESLKSFSNSDVYIEKLIENPKHIEVQVLADEHGNYIQLFERECSVQRRHQKVVEEAPSSSINDKLRQKVTEAALNAAKACNYFNAGTVEFLYDQKEDFYFLEMNTRLQVEHPVTEMITGVDIVKEQIKIAAGEKLSINQRDIKINGHAIECRIYAEDVDNNFSPSIGNILHHRLPSGPGIRVDRGIDVLSEVSIYYDPMLSKLIGWGKDREEALIRTQRALGEYQIAGVKTNINFFFWILSHELFITSKFDNNFLEKYFLPLVPDKWRENTDEKYANAAAILGAYLKSNEKAFKSVKICPSENNKWENSKYE